MTILCAKSYLSIFKVVGAIDWNKEIYKVN